VAGCLRKAGFGTLLFDLLTTEEDQYFENRFDIALLKERLVGATRWVEGLTAPPGASLGYFGASTGAAAALWASTECKQIRAVVSRGGRPDLAEGSLEMVTAPTLLIVGGRDEEVMRLNQDALARMKVAEKELFVVPGATHLFEEPGALERVASLAVDWFGRFLK
jgi:dienelactone hydrolase